MRLFSFRKLFCNLFLLFFGLFFRNGKREETWEGRLRGRCRCVQHDSIELFVHKELRIIINSNASK